MTGVTSETTQPRVSALHSCVVTTHHTHSTQHTAHSTHQQSLGKSADLINKPGLPHYSEHCINIIAMMLKTDKITKKYIWIYIYVIYCKLKKDLYPNI